MRCSWGLRACCAVLLLAVSISTPPGAQAQSRSTSLRVVTWNIHAENPDRLAAALEQTGADVIALQEVDAFQTRSGCRHQAFEIARRLGMHARLGANIRSPGQCGNGRQALYGDAVLSRYPILEWKHTLLPNQGGEQRGMTESVLDVDGRHVRVVATHLEYGSGSERRAQAEAVSERLEGSAEPVVVMGDMNAEPDDGTLGPLRQTFTDAWAAVGAGDGFTNPSGNPRRRIDYVFVRGMAPGAAEVLSDTTSDHLAVRADISL